MKKWVGGILAVVLAAALLWVVRPWEASAPAPDTQASPAPTHANKAPAEAVARVPDKVQPPPGPLDGMPKPETAVDRTLVVLLRGLHDGQPEVRAACLQELERFMKAKRAWNPAYVPFFLSAMSEQNQDAAVLAEAVVYASADLEATLRNANYQEYVREALMTAAAKRPEGLRALAACANASDQDTSARALKALRAREAALDPARTEQLLADLLNPLGPARKAALQALSKQVPPSALRPGLRACLADRDWEVKTLALQGFGRLVSLEPGDLPALGVALRDTMVNVSEEAAKVLVQDGRPETQRMLLDELNRRCTPGLTAIVLAGLRGQAFLKEVEALGAKNPKVRLLALQWCGRTQGSLSPLVEACREVLKNHAKAGEHAVGEALRLLAEAGPEASAAAPEILALPTYGLTAEKVLAGVACGAKGTPLIGALYARKTPGEREAVLRVLAEQVRADGASELMEALAMDGDEERARWVLDGLTTYSSGGPRQAEALLRVLERVQGRDRVICASKLFELKNDALPVLPAVAARHQDLKERALLALKQAGPLAAPVWEEALQAADADVRTAARAALQDLGPLGAPALKRAGAARPGAAPQEDF